MKTFEELKSEFDAKIAAMTESELVSALERAGCVFVDPWSAVEFSDDFLYFSAEEGEPSAHDGLALAA